jgi:hypothetical protein
MGSALKTNSTSTTSSSATTGPEVDPEVRELALGRQLADLIAPPEVPLEVLICGLIESATRTFDSHIAQIHIDCSDRANVCVVLAPEIKHIDITFSVDL